MSILLCHCTMRTTCLSHFPESMSLTRKQLNFLRGRAHALAPVVSVGNAGLSEAVMRETEIALAHHELIKIKLASDDRDMRNRMCEQICQLTHAEMVQQIGKIVVVYRPGEKSRISLP